MPKTPKTPPTGQKRCSNCKLYFTPKGKNPANIKRQRFCCTACRMNYHCNGGMDMPRLVEMLTRKLEPRMREIVREELQTSAVPPDTAMTVAAAIQRI